MTELSFWLDCWRTNLKDAESELPREPFAASREILRQRIANYRSWIAQAEARLGYAEAA